MVQDRERMWRLPGPGARWTGKRRDVLLFAQTWGSGGTWMALSGPGLCRVGMGGVNVMIDKQENNEPEES